MDKYYKSSITSLFNPVSSIIVSILYALIINILDTTIKTSEDVERICDLPVLASIPIFDVGQPKKKGGKNR